MWAYSSEEEHRAFNPSVEIPKFSKPSIVGISSSAERPPDTRKVIGAAPIFPTMSAYSSEAERPSYTRMILGQYQVGLPGLLG